MLIPKHAEYLRASNRKQCHDDEADDGCAQRDLSAMVAIHARCECQKQRRETGRIDGDEEGDEGAENRIVEPHAKLAPFVGILCLICEKDCSR